MPKTPPRSDSPQPANNQPGKQHARIDADPHYAASTAGPIEQFQKLLAELIARQFLPDCYYGQSDTADSNSD
jgi:hypothetical protein